MDARGRGYCYWGVVLREATTSLYNLPVPPESDTSWQVKQQQLQQQAADPPATYAAASLLSWYISWTYLIDP
jgi:hypothetical protein